jgi:hypothetical protein
MGLEFVERGLCQRRDCPGARCRGFRTIGVAEWTELLRRIGSRCAPNGEALVTTLCREAFSLPAIAAMLRADCQADQGFTQSFAVSSTEISLIRSGWPTMRP